MKFKIQSSSHTSHIYIVVAILDVTTLGHDSLQTAEMIEKGGARE